MRTAKVMDMLTDAHGAVLAAVVTCQAVTLHHWPCLPVADRRTRVVGGLSPVNFQSVIDSPERVSRVMPPSTTMLKTQPEHPASHQPTCLRALSDKPAV